MENKILELCKRVVKGEVDLAANIMNVSCMGIECCECPFSGDKHPTKKYCGLDRTEYYIEKAKEYIKEHTQKVSEEKTFREVIATIKEGEVWVSDTAPISFISLREYGALDFNENVGVNLKCKYKLQRKEYTFEEAFKAYEKGGEIESCYSKYKYKKANGVDSYSRTGNNWYEETSFDIEEIRGKWYINS